MFRHILSHLVENPASIVETEKGIAFLAAARQIYDLPKLSYFCLNLPRRSTQSFVHCAFAESWAVQAATPAPIPLAKLASTKFFNERELEESHAGQGYCFSRTFLNREQSFLRLNSWGDEFALVGFDVSPMNLDPDHPEVHMRAELRILGNYFHNHMLRRHGSDTSDALLMSARELDCLKWAAAGKSAWEASIILGITERTVRFHLNSAREKLNCTTTTQAVAKVVAQQLIPV